MPAFDQLDELRRFRHVFRAAYGVELDAERMALVVRKGLALRRRLPLQIESFLAFLESLDS
jgi:HepT-like protein